MTKHEAMRPAYGEQRTAYGQTSRLSRRTAERPAEPAAGQDGSTGFLLTLQRQAGNRAVCALLGRPSVQRFVGKEHKELGDTTGRTIDLGHGVVLSWGDLVALAGDQYGTADELLADTKDDAGRQRLLAAFREDDIPDPAHATLPEPTAKQRSDQFVTYIKLAAENPAHFSSGGQAVTRWVTDHTTALTAALDAGLRGDSAALQVALAREAFGQHFLSDAFSGGHIRTPRPDIIGWYRANFGPPVVEEFIRRLSGRLIEGLVQQISPQTMWPDVMVRGEVSKEVGKRLGVAIAGIGGRAKLNDYFALGVAGIISGAMHDLEGTRGVAVSSEAHPEPWTAFGDARLAGSPVSRAQAEQAIAAATAQIDTAYAIGRAHGAAADPGNAPTIAYFGFDSAGLTPDTAQRLNAAAAYLHAHPEVQVTLTGHTDPTGAAAYNEELGLRRANTVGATLRAAGVRADQMVLVSNGERSPATTAANQFRLNRRVVLDYTTRPGPYRDPARDEALVELQTRLPAAYPQVTRFVPQPLAAPAASPGTGASTVGGSQVQLEAWRWGSIPSTLRGAIDTWVRGHREKLTSKISTAKELDDDRVKGYDIHPRPLVEAIVNDLLKEPSRFMEDAVGRPMSP